MNEASVFVIQSMFRMRDIKAIVLRNLEFLIAKARRRRVFEITKFLDGLRELNNTGSDHTEV